ncbi:MAG: 4-hydroxybenzoate 3-monooxygenase [Acidimicrobiales bacterium]
MRELRTQVGIVGAGPAGLLLSHLLAQDGVDSIVLERRSREYVEQRVRAGVLEHSTAELLTSCGVGERMRREGLVHHGIELRFDGVGHRMPLTELADGRSLVVYGQQEVVKDLIAARFDAGGTVLFGTEVLALDGAFERDGGGPGPRLEFRAEDGEAGVVSCEVVAGCDGSHGACHAAVAGRATVFTRDYPFAWLGILAAAPPSTGELIYCRSDRGFSLYSMRSPELSRLYLQVPPGEPLDAWSDDRIWEELRTRLATGGDWSLSEGPILERSVTTMRSMVVEPMRFGSLFLAGDAAHVVPPTGAKGMNLAVADVRLLAEALVHQLTKSDGGLAEEYSTRCLRRAWRAQEFSYYMTTMLHPLAGDEYNSRLQLARLDHLVHSEGAGRWLAECYVDLTGS